MAISSLENHSTFIDPHPPRPCSVHRIAPMGSGEPYQVTRLSEKINFYAPPTFNPEVHDDIPESFVTWSYWFGLRPNWEAIAQPKQYYSELRMDKMG